jgi:hypothetical protein
MWKTIAALLILAAVAVADPISFSLINANLTGTPGSTLTFQYQVTNNSGAPIFAAGLNSGSFVSGTADASVFDAFNFDSIADGATLTGPLFAFTADPAVANSFNSGAFDLTVTDSTFTNLTDLFADYTVTIASNTPEPSTLGFMVLGTVLLVWRKRNGLR